VGVSGTELKVSDSARQVGCVRARLALLLALAALRANVSAALAACVARWAARSAA
jgi:hypothetical protein